MNDTQLFDIITTHKPYYETRYGYLKEQMNIHQLRIKQGKGKIAWENIKNNIFEDYRKWRIDKH